VRKIIQAVVTASALLLLSAAAAHADIVFTFDSPGSGLNTSSTSANIAAYMSSVLGCLNCVTLNSGVHVDHGYTGDGHAVGPGGVALTLGDSNGATSNNASITTNANDLFLANTSDSSSSSTDRIVINFTQPMSGVFSFDFQIFPDGTCPSLSNCGTSQSNLPDLEFSALNASNTVLSSHTFWAVAPCATVGACQGSANSGTNGSSIHSPASGSGTELAPQLIGTYTTGYLNNVTQLDFIDWPATIAIDNLKIATPEPRGGVFVMGGLLLAAVAAIRLRSAFAKA
jgi:hypothetical protein